MRTILTIIAILGLALPALADSREWVYSEEMENVYYGTPETDDVLIRMACGDREGEITLVIPYYATKPYSREQVYDRADEAGKVALRFSIEQADDTVLEEIVFGGEAIPFTDGDEPGGWFWEASLDNNHPAFDFLTRGEMIRVRGYGTVYDVPATAGAVLKSLRKVCPSR